MGDRSGGLAGSSEGSSDDGRTCWEGREASEEEEEDGEVLRSLREDSGVGWRVLAWEEVMLACFLGLFSLILSVYMYIASLHRYIGSLYR